MVVVVDLAPQLYAPAINASASPMHAFASKPRPMAIADDIFAGPSGSSWLCPAVAHRYASNARRDALFGWPQVITVYLWGNGRGRSSKSNSRNPQAGNRIWTTERKASLQT
jgi:hypothetical protein